MFISARKFGWGPQHYPSRMTRHQATYGLKLMSTPRKSVFFALPEKAENGVG
jgi:hypothetical protein